VVAAEAAPEAAYSAPLLGTNGAAVFAFRVGCIAVGRARRRIARRPAHQPFGGDFEVIYFLPRGLAARSCTVNWLEACNRSSRKFPCFRVCSRSRLVRARQRDQRHQITAAQAASGALDDGPCFPRDVHGPVGILARPPQGGSRDDR